MACLTPILLLICLVLLPALSAAEDFTLKKISGAEPGPTLLVIGGIHGDEPGGFNAAALLTTRYRLKSGALWIIPDLNRTSILKRSHGWYGNMNYKFNGLPKSDMDYRIVQQVKKLLTEPQVNLILNLHDGSGFYHPQRQSNLRNPDRWGQSCVIDQTELSGHRFGQLEELSLKAVEQINQNLLQPEHRFRLKNTQTAEMDEVMRKSLTFFAIRNSKPAIGLEASKTLPTDQRVFYLLSAMEALFEQVGIEFERDFPLNPAAINQALTSDIELELAEGRIKLQLTNMRPELAHFPLEKGVKLRYHADNPLVSVKKIDDRYRIFFGNNRLAYLNPDFVAYDRSLRSIDLRLDGRTETIALGQRVKVKNSLEVPPLPGYRANLIGFQHPQHKNEVGLKISPADLNEAYSIDKDGRIFRLEIYREDKFCGMVLVEFDP